MILSAGISIDGYRLIRKIGQGGFGEVWLAQSQATGAWKALKWIPASSNRHFEQELSSLRRYVNAISSLRCPQLVPIEHVRLDEQGLAYVMPLADGNAIDNPEDPAWEPTTLAHLLTRHREAGSWFTSGQIRSIIQDVLAGAAAIGDVGMLHRDIKPENVLFLAGRPCLADFGLSTAEATMVSLRGTPYHTAPSWYVENGGNADQWGVAALLYVLLTGNSPDKIGRARFLWPLSGRDSLSKEEQSEWQRLHQVVLRATSETPNQRFLGMEAFRSAMHGEVFPAKRKTVPVWVFITIIAVIGSSIWWHTHRPLTIQNESTPPKGTPIHIPPGSSARSWEGYFPKPSPGSPQHTPGKTHVISSGSSIQEMNAYEKEPIDRGSFGDMTNMMPAGLVGPWPTPQAGSNQSHSR